MGLLGTLLPIAAGAVTSLIGNKVNASERRKEQERGMAMQLEANKEMAELNYQQQMKMWHDTNYTAQREELEKAGLNPALLYGQTGGGGATTGSGVSGSTSVPAAGTYGLQQMEIGLMMAQKEKIEAEAEKAKAEAEKTRGIDTKAAETQQKLNEINLQVQEKIGIEQLEKKAQIELQSANATNAKNIREFEAWMSQAFDTTTGNFNVDALGAYSTSNNDLIKKSIRAGMIQTTQELEKLKKELTLKDDEHTLNKIDMEIKDFESDLTKLGLNQTSASIINTIIKTIFGKRH